MNNVDDGRSLTWPSSVARRCYQIFPLLDNIIVASRLSADPSVLTAHFFIKIELESHLLT